MSRARVTVLFTLSIVLAACSDNGDKTQPDSAVGTDTIASSNITALLPAANAVGDFAQQQAPEGATTAQQLNDLIDGGSEKYTQGGKFVSMALVTYASSTKPYTLEVWLFDETDAAGATQAYLATKNADDQDLSPVIGEAARGHMNAIVGIYRADMRKGRYLARVTASTSAGQEDALALLRKIASAIP